MLAPQTTVLDSLWHLKGAPSAGATTATTTPASSSAPSVCGASCASATLHDVLAMSCEHHPHHNPHKKKEPLREQYGSDEEFAQAHARWKSTREKNNESVRSVVALHLFCV